MKISKMKLYAHDLHKMKAFYCDILGFELLEEAEHFFEIAAGESVIQFETLDASVAKQYHFALNIPSNLFQQAKKWAQARVDLLRLDEQDEVYFKTLDANSCYFYDPEDNVIEFIARHGINPSVNTDAFSIKHVLNIAEINLTTDAIHAVADRLKEYGITPLKGEEIRTDALTFMGNYEDGVHLLIGPSERIWYFSTKKAIVSPINIIVNNYLHLYISVKGDFAISQF
ncbi:VOC family protein [Lysinibacillus sp. NPDC093210]|uniref:VOC family protein n=1 Tax=Lysinibacillus sp. NPDC093210 TaxID=3364133 RepID=UPI00381170A4